MKYALELESPDMGVLFKRVESTLLNALLVHHQKCAQGFGRGHSVTIAAGREVEAMRRAISALRKAIDEAVPDRADGEPFEGSLQTGDEMSLVYGRPRNDPRDARQKPHWRKRR